MIPAKSAKGPISDTGETKRDERLLTEHSRPLVQAGDLGHDCDDGDLSKGSGYQHAHYSCILHHSSHHDSSRCKTYGRASSEGNEDHERE